MDHPVLNLVVSLLIVGAAFAIQEFIFAFPELGTALLFMWLGLMFEHL